VGSHGRSMHFVVVFLPPQSPAQGVRPSKPLGGAVQWRLENIRVLQISSTGGEFDRTSNFKIDEAIHKFNSESEEFVQLILLVPETVSMKLHTQECKSNKFVAEFIFSIKAYGQSIEQKVRSNVIYVGSKARNVPAERYAEFIAHKMEYIENMSKAVDRLRGSINEQDPETLPLYITEKVLNRNTQNPYFESDDDIIRQYNRLKRGRPSNGPSNPSGSRDGPTVPTLPTTATGTELPTALRTDALGDSALRKGKDCDGSCVALIARLRDEIAQLKGEVAALKKETAHSQA